MSTPTKSIAGLTRQPPPGDLTEDDVRAWLKSFYASEVAKTEILKRLAKQAAFWRD